MRSCSDSHKDENVNPNFFNMQHVMSTNASANSGTSKFNDFFSQPLRPDTSDEDLLLF